LAPLVEDRVVLEIS
jgi:hypothetical protein